MNVQACVVTAFVGLTSPLMAQSLSVNLSWNTTSIATGDTATGTVSASFSGFADGSYLSSVNIDLIGSSNAFRVISVGTVPWNNAALGFDGQGTASGVDVLGVEASQFSLIPPFSTDNPVLVFSFEVQRIGNGVLQYSADVADGAPFAFSVTGPLFNDQPVSFGSEVFTSRALIGIPAPAALPVLGSAALFAGRRRRSVS
ncbi:MAG: hypothetical protein AAGA55_04055 [Planctomycetota bacterium]